MAEKGVSKVPVVPVHMDLQEVKIEYTSDEDSLENEEDDVEKNYDPRLNSEPLVLTTRLDDMCIFYKINDSMTIKDITNSILKESVPKYNNKKPVNQPCSKGSYQSLARKLNTINEKAACINSVSKEVIASNSTDFLLETLTDNVCLRNARLLEMCKPFSVVLEKLVFFKNNVVITEKNRRNPMSKKVLTQCLVFQDYSTNETNIYCIKNDTITENHTLKNINDEAIIPYMTAYKKAGMNPRKVNFCCWHQREAFIVSLDREFNDDVKELMKKPHKCAFDQCICCCRSSNCKDDVTVANNTNENNSGEISVEDFEINELEKEISEAFLEIKHNTVEYDYGYKSNWLETLLSEEKKDTLVGKALSYTRPHKSTKDDDSKPVINNLKTKYVRQFYSKDINRAEIYELQEKGHVVACLKEDLHSIITSTADQKSMFYQKHKHSVEKPVITCCWYGREKNVNKLYADSPSLARFIKLPHTCLPKNCTCCCKPKFSPPLTRYTILPSRKVPKHTKIITKNVKNNIESQPRLSVEVKADAKRQPPNKTKLMQSQIVQNPIKILPKPSTHTVQSLGKSIRSTVGDEALIINNITTIPSYEPIQKINKDGNICIKHTNQNDDIVTSQICNNRPQESSIATDDVQDLAVDSMITTILDRFKDVRLTINEDGKVAAALNAPVDTLTTAELKVLAKILSHAQKQVKAMGLGPGSLLTTQESANMTGTSTQPSSVGQVKENVLTKPMIEFSTKTVTSKETGSKTVNIYPKPGILSNFADISQYKNKLFTQSYSSYIECKKNGPGNTAMRKDSEDGTGIPKISNVFSIKDAENDSSLSESVKLSALEAWSGSTNAGFVVAAKRKTSDSETHPPNKIRVVDPAKLGISQPFQSDILSDAKARDDEKEQFKVLNSNLINSQLSNFLSNAVTIIPSSGNFNSNLFAQSLPRISNVTGNAVISPTPSNNTSSHNNILVINPLPPFNSLPTGNALISLKSNEMKLATPMNIINTVAQNIQVMPHDASGTVFHISNLNKMSIAKPILLNAEPVLQPKLNANPPPLVRVAPKPPGAAKRKT